MINVAGIGILSSSSKPKLALKLVQFLLSPQAQSYFAQKVFEYPVTAGTRAHPLLLPMPKILKLTSPQPLEALQDLQGTINLLRKVGLL